MHRMSAQITALLQERARLKRENDRLRAELRGSSPAASPRSTPASSPRVGGPRLHSDAPPHAQLP